ncbi:homing endonuclease [Salmonella phage SE5]|uniref:Homing endonuclease n=1 Tax=Salmonella phage SE5 TaxID=2575329 RepID=A0A5B9N133_9CAUD|nr:homing endonuclease [Salmonella phage SE5]
MCELTHSELRSLLKYRKTTGEFIWKDSGEVAGHLSKSGYIQIKVNSKTYRAHLLAWYYVTGEYPIKIIDHKNHKRYDNRWKNLREATHAMNSWNTSLRSDSKSGVKGVCYDERTGRWRARVTVFGKTYGCGYHTSKKAAEAAVRTRRVELHGEFACHG